MYCLLLQQCESPPAAGSGSLMRSEGCVAWPLAWGLIGEGYGSSLSLFVGPTGPSSAPSNSVETVT